MVAATTSSRVEKALVVLQVCVLCQYKRAPVSLSFSHWKIVCQECVMWLYVFFSDRIWIKRTKYIVGKAYKHVTFMCNWTQFENMCHLFSGLISTWTRRWWTSKATECHKDPSSWCPGGVHWGRKSSLCLLKQENQLCSYFMSSEIWQENCQLKYWKWQAIVKILPFAQISGGYSRLLTVKTGRL